MAETKDISKKPLGRGLGSLLGDGVLDDFKSKNLVPNKANTTDSKPSASEIKNTVFTQALNPLLQDHMRIWEIDIEKITANAFQPRKHFSPEKIAELAASIKEKGVLQPIVVRKKTENQFELIAGERRWRAAQAAGLHKIPAIIKNVENQESLELAIIENIQRHDLNPIEEAEAYERLSKEFHLSQAEIAQKVGKERATVANILRLLSLEESVRLMLLSGEISTGHAKVLLALNEPSLQKELAKKINSEKLTVRAAEKLIQTIQKKQNTKPENESDQTILALVQKIQEELGKTLGTKVDINYKMGQGTINIRFYSDDDLSRISEKIQN